MNEENALVQVLPLASSMPLGMVAPSNCHQELMSTHQIPMPLGQSIYQPLVIWF